MPEIGLFVPRQCQAISQTDLRENRVRVHTPPEPIEDVERPSWSEPKHVAQALIQV